MLKKRLYNVENNCSTVSLLKCAHFEFVSSSSAGLKSHVTKTNKREKLREAIVESSPSFSLFFDKGDEDELYENIQQAEQDCNYCSGKFIEGNILESHMICNHKVTENCSTCYGCDNEDLVLGQFKVLWDGGEVGGQGIVAVECVNCMNSPDMTPEELDACIKNQRFVNLP